MVVVIVCGASHGDVVLLQCIHFPPYEYYAKKVWNIYHNKQLWRKRIKQENVRTGIQKVEEEEKARLKSCLFAAPQ